MASALPDQPFAHPVQRLQIELVSRLSGNEFHRRALHRFGVAEIVFLPFAICAYDFAGISRAS